MTKLLKLAAIFIFAFSNFAGRAYAAEPVLTQTGSFTLEIKALTMYSGETDLPTSKGVVTFQGKQYPFTVQALTMGNSFGSTTFKANGVLYGMKDITQFESPFFIIGGGINPGEENDVVTYKNKKGVTAVMTGTVNGPLWVPSTGAVIKLLK